MNVELEKQKAEPAEGAPPRSTPGILHFLALCVQLALILFAVSLLRIEGKLPFFSVLCLAAGGFVVHAWLPTRFRLPFFTLLSLAAAVAVYGWETGAWIIGLGGALIALCYLPVPLPYRVLLIVGAGGGLLLWRAGGDEAFWPVLGSLFMFRLIVYLHDTRRDRRPPLFQSLAYFFPLPNFCFVLFPVIDFKTFRETYYDCEPGTIYQSGIAWIVRGLAHLLGYRLVKYYLLPAPHEMRDLPHLLLFLASNYALYLRVSGWFHVITGILHLFGFNLPRTHHNYFLASSVSDIWRRINVYWKDFMTKVFFYPAFFKLRRWGTRFALAAAGLWVFVMTWLLHSYQMFWLRGELPLRGHETVLWLGAGVIVTIALVRDYRRVEGDSGNKERESAALQGALHGLKIVGTFLLVSVFWAWWTLPTFPTYLRVLSLPGAVAVPGVLAVLGCVAAVVAISALVRVVGPAWRAGPVAARARRARLALLPTAALLVMIAIGVPQIGARLGSPVSGVLATLRLDSVTPVEAAMAVQGYYEDLADAPLQVSPLLGLPGLRRPEQSAQAYTEMTRPSDDWLERELIPGWSGPIGGRTLTINSLGMRDREGITKEKPDGVCRIAVVGSSVVMGYGVGDGETFTRLLDAGMNHERPGRFQVLNFGTGKSFAIHRRTLIERKVLSFDPDAIWYVAHQDEYLGPTRHLAGLAFHRNPLPPYLEAVVRRAGIKPGMAQGEMESLLQPFAPDILHGVYTDLVAECRRRGILPVWIYVPMPGVLDADLPTADLIGLAREAGFVVINLAGWADGHAPEEVKGDEHHANALGHRLIAERLGAVLRQRPDALPECARR
jgi:hypothetical protein